ncbi:MAG: mismatch repair protein [Myxococcaceae bacterium]|nr:mismatch repair protein [Myxococcaceae bacterium]
MALSSPPARPGARFDAPWPDLLHPDPKLVVDAAGLEKVLAFSFVAGDDAGVLATALDSAPIAASDFDPACFFDELFVTELARGVMRVQIKHRNVALNEGYLLRLLSHPPRDPRAVTLRSEIWRELADQPALRHAVEVVYLHVGALRRLFEGEGRVNIKGEQARRRLDILKSVQQTFAAMAAPELQGSTSQLTRIAGYAAHVQDSAAMRQLDELMRYENERAYADLTVQLAADGSVRGLKIVGVREDVQSRYHVPVLQQWLGRAWLWLKGYRVTEGEVLDRWLDQVFDGVCAFIPPLLQLLGDLELYLSGLAMRDHLMARGLTVCLPEWAEPGQPSQIEGLFNPLLVALDVTPVTCSLELGALSSTTLLTGPNSGGKTRLLQAVGLLQLCAHAGMFVPASSARLPRIPGIFASLSQAASAEQAEGRLGTELLRIRMLFERARPGYLVLIDELCSGTSPSEGEELFRLVLELLAELAPVALVSTHFLKFAAALSHDPSMPTLHFLQVELDGCERPTYRFIPGVATTSLARQTAARLGVTREELRALMQRAKR